MKCYALGLGLDTFRMVALTQNFRRLDVGVLMNTFKRWEPWPLPWLLCSHMLLHGSCAPMHDHLRSDDSFGAAVASPCYLLPRMPCNPLGLQIKVTGSRRRQPGSRGSSRAGGFIHSVLTGRTFCRAQKRLLLLDYDGTLVPQSTINSRPTEEALSVLTGLCADPRNAVYIISGRRKAELAEWFAAVVSTLCPCLSMAVSRQSPHPGKQERAGLQRGRTEVWRP